MEFLYFATTTRKKQIHFQKACIVKPFESHHCKEMALLVSSEEINLQNIVIIIQQYPGAKVKNQDGQQVEAWLKKFEEQPGMPKLILSDF